MEIVDCYSASSNSSVLVKHKGITYEIHYTRGHKDTKKRCSVCGKTDHVSLEFMDKVYEKIIDPETMLETDANSELGRLLIKKAQKQTDRTICKKCAIKELQALKEEYEEIGYEQEGISRARQNACQD